MSFNDNLVKVGDRVVVKMDKETRYWRGGLPDGTLGYVIGRQPCITYVDRWGRGSYNKPGVYSFDGTALILWDGTNKPVSGGYDYEFADKALYEERVKAYREYPIENDDVIARGWHFENRVRLSDLPETKFWEGDIVRYTGDGFEDSPPLMMVYSINWHWETDERGWCYGVNWVDENHKDARCGSTNLHDCDLELVERGNLWKLHHNEPLKFFDLNEEASFAKQIGEATEVRNPSNGFYSWSLEEALDFIQSGGADGFTAGIQLFGMTRSPHVLKFNDVDLGSRVREETLRGFGRL